MVNAAKKWSKMVGSIKVFIGGWILLILLGLVYKGYVNTEKNGSIVRHIIIRRALEDHVNRGGEILQSLSEIDKLQYTSGNEEHSLDSTVSFERANNDFRYYPAAWNRPGEILLQSSVLGSYVVTFGDGSLAVLSYWDRQPRKELINEGGLGNEEHYLRSRCALGTLPVVTLFVLLVVSFFIIVIVERIIKRKRRRASAP